MQRGQWTSGLVVVADDDPSLRLLVRRWLESAGHRVEDFGTGDDLIPAVERLSPDAVLLDLNMPGQASAEVQRRLRVMSPEVPVIIITVDGSIGSVVSAVQEGAWDYLVKPLDRNKLLTTVKNAVERRRLQARLRELEREVSGRSYHGILGGSDVMQALFRQVDRVAASDITTLIQGESGTGKELVARAIHAAGTRRNGPFVALNCAAIPESLQEAELFGHERGAFTGASDRREGRFEQADGGTLFLDEVGDLSPSLQAKVLRAIQERTFYRIGGSREVRSDFRLIAATHRSLVSDVASGRFRDDLYFRIAVFDMEVPPLRTRGGDVFLLARAFLDDYSSRLGRPSPVLSEETVEALQAWSWPGNVRELQNTIHRAMVLSSGDRIDLEHLPARIRGGVPEATEGSRLLRPAGVGSEASRSPAFVRKGQPLSLADIERDAILAAWNRTHGNVSEMTRQLQVGRTTLYRKLRSYDIKSPGSGGD